MNDGYRIDVDLHLGRKISNENIAFYYLCLCGFLCVGHENRRNEIDVDESVVGKEIENGKEFVERIAVEKKVVKSRGEDPFKERE